MTGKHRTTVYIDKELAAIAKARKINISEALEKVLRMTIGDTNPERRMKELKEELALMEAALEARKPYETELKDLGQFFEERRNFRTELNLEWIRSRVINYPYLRSRFTTQEVLDLLLEA